MQPVRLTTGLFEKAPYPAPTVGAPAAKAGEVVGNAVATPETPTITSPASSTLPAAEKRAQKCGMALDDSEPSDQAVVTLPLRARAAAGVFRIWSSPVVAPPRSNHVVSLQSWAR